MSEASDTCPICLDDGSDMKLPCGHKSHASCITRWKLRGGRTCPLCRATLGAKKVVRLPEWIQSTTVLITGVKAGKGQSKDMAIFIYRDPRTGVVGTIVPAISHEERRRMLVEPRLAIGRTMNVIYRNRTDDGHMLFPVGISFA